MKSEFDKDPFSDPTFINNFFNNFSDEILCQYCFLTPIDENCKSLCAQCCQLTGHECKNEKKSKKRKANYASSPSSPLTPPSNSSPFLSTSISPNSSLTLSSLPPNFPKVTLEIVKSDDHPYPIFWIRPDRLHPEPVLLVRNYPWDENNIIVMAVPIDSATHLPIPNIHLLENTECVNSELSNKFQGYQQAPVYATKFKGLKVGTTSHVVGLSNNRGNKLRLNYVLFSKHVYPPQFLAEIEGDDIRLYNRRNELPAPEISKISPNIIRINKKEQLTIFAQLLSQGRGKISMGFVYLGMNSNFSLEQEWIPQGNFSEIREIKTSEWHRFSFDFITSKSGYIAFSLRYGSATESSKGWGVGRLIFVQSNDSGSDDLTIFPSLSSGNNNNFEDPSSDSFSNNPSSFSNNSNSGSSSSSSGSSNLSGGGPYYQNNIFFLSAQGKNEQLESLLEKEIDTNIYDKHGNFPLYYAALYGHKDTIELLARYNSNLDQQNAKNGDTPLHVASRKGFFECVKTLVDLGANCDLKNKHGVSTLHEASIHGHLEIVNYLIQICGEINEPDVSSFTPFHYAVIHNHLPLVEFFSKYFSECGISLDVVDLHGYTPLHWAVGLNRYDMVKILIECGANVNFTDNYQETPLFHAVKNDKEAIVKLLLQFKARCDIWNVDNMLPIHFIKSENIRNLLLIGTRINTPKTRNTVIFNPDLNLSNSVSCSSSPQEFNSSYTSFEELIELKKKNHQLLLQLEQLTKQIAQLQFSQKSPIETSTLSSLMELEKVKSPHPISVSPPSSKVEIISPKLEMKKPTSTSESEFLNYKIFTKNGDCLAVIPFKKNTKLSEVREQLKKDKRIPSTYYFWFEAMDSRIEEHQEKQLKIEKVEQIILDVIITSPSEYWLSKYKKSDEVSVDLFIDHLRADFPMKSKDKAIETIVEVGMKEFFEVELDSFKKGGEIRKKGGLTLDDFETFCILFGPLENCQEHVYDVFRETFFHGFITHEHACRLLDKNFSFLIRFSSSEHMKEGCYVLEINKGQKGIQSYYIRYNAEKQKFTFSQKEFGTFREFTQHPEFKEILKYPISRQRELQTI